MITVLYLVGFVLALIWSSKINLFATALPFAVYKCFVIRPLNMRNLSILLTSRMRPLLLQACLAILSFHTTVASWSHVHAQDSSQG